jgi:ACS family tartrate transporter-like MFS transporter
MLFLEGIPAVFLGVLCYLYLTDRPEQAGWLADEEKVWLLAELERDRQARKDVRHFGALKAMSNPKVLYLAFIYFVYQCGSLGVGYWMPQIIKGFSSTLSHTQIGLIATIPYIVATLVMIAWSRRSDRHGERRLHSALPLAVAAVALVGAGLVREPYLAIGLISLALAGLYSFKSPFWALPTLFLSRSTAAVSIAVINSIGNLGDFVGPFMIGMVKGNTQSASAGLLFLSALLAIAFIMTLLIRLDRGDDTRAAAATT